MLLGDSNYTGLISDSTSLSTAVTCGRHLANDAYCQIGSFFPIKAITDSDWDTAAMSFQAAGPDGAFYDVYDEFGSEVSISGCVASRAYNLDPSWFRGAAQIKVRSGVTGTPVLQGGATTVRIILTDFE